MRTGEGVRRPAVPPAVPPPPPPPFYYPPPNDPPPPPPPRSLSGERVSRQVVEKGAAVQRFREFVVFHSDLVLPLYLVAYQRKP